MYYIYTRIEGKLIEFKSQGLIHPVQRSAPARREVSHRGGVGSEVDQQLGFPGHGQWKWGTSPTIRNDKSQMTL